jgi:hypothetical protein
MDAETKQQFERLNKKLNELIAGKQQGERWVGAGWVTDLTGWSPEKMRQARESKLIEFKRNKTGGYLYKLESIPEIFIKQKQAS